MPASFRRLAHPSWERVGQLSSVTLIALIGFAALASPGAGAASWQPSVALSVEGANAYEPKIALAPDGDAVTVWFGNGFSDEGLLVQATRRPPGGSWSQPPAEVSSRVAFFPQVGIDAQGDALAVWQLNDE